jgi:hypothetical protein
LDMGFTEIKDIFYYIFRQNKACRNLFLLSKEELLDTKTIEFEDETKYISFPRLIISNVDKDKELHEKLKLRNETNLIKSNSTINSKIDIYRPLITNYFEGKFGKSLEKFSNDVNDNSLQIVKIIFKLISSNQSKREKLIIDQLQKYGFVGKHIKSFDQMEDFFQKEIFTKNINSILNENNLWNILEFLKSIKDIYLNESYKTLYSSNQILVNSLVDLDNYEDRLRLFDILYENGIIFSSKEDSFFECIDCPPGNYRGTLQIKVNPGKLKDFKCPICSKNLSYYVPFGLHKDIFDIIKQKDGLLLDALCNNLTFNKIEYKTNVKLLNDIELDCTYKIKDISFIIESKMYKVNTEPKKLKSKIKEHFVKLTDNIKRLESENIYDKNTIPILLVNIASQDIIKEVEIELKEKNSDEISQKTCIYNIEQMLNL